MNTANFWFQGAGGDGPTPIQIGNSLRFRGAQYLWRSNQASDYTWTWSIWVKKSAIASGARNINLSRGTNCGLGVDNADQLYWVHDDQNIYTGVYLRDPSAWYHFVVKSKRIEGDNASEMWLYMNGEEISYRPRNIRPFFSYASQGCAIGRYGNSGSNYWEGYMAEAHLVDGQALDITTFAEYDANGVWVPKEVTGLTYGTNGFYLDFSDPNDIGADRSGNGNNYTPFSFELTDTSSTSYDLMEDSPTNNYATLNPLDISSWSGTPPLSNANLTWNNNQAAWLGVHGGISPNAGKYYFEYTVEVNNYYAVGLAVPGSDLDSYNGNPGLYGLVNTGQLTVNGVLQTWDVAGSVGDVVGVEYDADTFEMRFYRNGSQLQGPGPAMTLPAGTYLPWLAEYTMHGSINFGQRPFLYPPGTSSPTTAFNTVLYNGNSGTQSITGVGFEPDFVWIKSRSNSYGSYMYDVIRGPGVYLASSETQGDYPDIFTLTSFNSDGFSLDYAPGVNNNGSTYVAWCWNAGDGDPVINNEGTIESTVKASPENGFSVVTFTKTGGTNASNTVGHGLGVAPAMMILKGREPSNEDNWYVYHQSLGPTYRTYLNTTDASISPTNTWDNTAPTDTVFTVKNLFDGDSVAYCFANVEGKVKIGTWAGINDANAPGEFVECGFKPSMVLAKRTNASGGWYMFDTKRGNGGNAADPNYMLRADDTTRESGEGYTVWCDFYPTGFQPMGTSGFFKGGGGDTIAYIAFAEDFTSDAKPLASANLEPVDIKDPSDHFQTILGPGPGTGSTTPLAIQYKTSNTADSPAATYKDLVYGKPATDLGATTGNHPLFSWAATVDINGHNDWYIPAFYELKVLYRNLKPTTASNDTTFGANPHAVPPVGNYTASDPAQTTVAVFQEGGAEEFAWDNAYWASSEVPSNVADAYRIGFYSGYEYTSPTGKTLAHWARVIRRVSFTGSEPAIGAAYQGGFFGGLIDAKATPDGTATHALIVAPKNGGEYGVGTGILDVAQRTFPNGLWWIKDRANANQNQLVDSVRGGNLALRSPLNGGEVDYVTPTGNSVAWCWNATETFTPTSSDGLTNLSGQRNVKAGFSIVAYSGSNANASFTHGLSQAPEFRIHACRTSSGDFPTQHISYPDGNRYQYLTGDTGLASNSNVWHGKFPDNTLAYVGTNPRTNSSGNDYIAYMWHSVPGYSSFGSYVGNGDPSGNGTFIYTGFRPAWVMYKRYDSPNGWHIIDSARNLYNPCQKVLEAQLSNPEETRYLRIDILSNGFKQISSLGGNNANGGTYIYAAFAEHPFGASNVSPSPAR